MNATNVKSSRSRRTKSGAARKVALLHKSSDKRLEALQRTRQELKRARDCAQAIVETVPPLLVLDPDLRVKTANQSFYKHFRVSPSQTENCLVYELGNGQWNIPKLRTLLEEVLPRHSFFNDFEVRHKFETVGRRTVLLSGRQIDGVQRILLFIEDITERMDPKTAMRASEIRYRRLFEAARDGILILDPSTRKITDANPFMTELLGYPHEQLLGKELWEIGLLKDEKASRTAFRELQQKHFIRYEDLPLQTKTGKHHEVEFVSNLYDEDGRDSHSMQYTRHHRAQASGAGANETPKMKSAGMPRTWKKWSRNAPASFAKRSVNWKDSPTAYRMTCARRCGPCKASAQYLVDEYSSKLDEKALIIFTRSCARPSGWIASSRMS